VPHGTPGCDDLECVEIMCGNDGLDPACCSVGWGGACALTADDQCPVCAIENYDCSEVDIGSAVGDAVASGSTVGEDDDLGQSCGLGGGPDAIVTWTAPSSGPFAFDTSASGYDTVLSIYDECESNTELVCDDDGGPGTTSLVVHAVTAGETYVIAVSGYNGATGSWVLDIDDAFGCGEVDIGSAVGDAVASGSTVGEDEDLAQSCGAGGGPDAVVTWTAPSSGTFTFDTSASAYDTVLSIHAACGSGTELACDDDTGPGTTSQVVYAATAGVTYAIAVSGYNGATGSWVLDIN
jgi:hypothetical protein